jgi:uncharacterized protein
MSIGERIAKLSERFYDRVRSRAARDAGKGARTRGFEHLRGQKYCLLVTYRRSGEPVPTPVWFGLDASGTLYLRSTAEAWKVKRVRTNAAVSVAPCTVRGKPLGPAAEGRARILSPDRQEHAERAIQANYGLGRRLYEGLNKSLNVDVVYLEVSPAGPGPSPTTSRGV